MGRLKRRQACVVPNRPSRCRPKKQPPVKIPGADQTARGDRMSPSSPLAVSLPVASGLLLPRSPRQNGNECPHKAALLNNGGCNQWVPLFLGRCCSGLAVTGALVGLDQRYGQIASSPAKPACPDERKQTKERDVAFEGVCYQRLIIYLGVILLGKKQESSPTSNWRAQKRTQRRSMQAGVLRYSTKCTLYRVIGMNMMVR